MRRVAVSFACYIALIGCSSSEELHPTIGSTGTAASHQTASSALASSSTAAAIWPSVLDRPSGIRFKMPGKPSMTKRQLSAGDGTLIDDRTYALDLSANRAVKVEIETGVQRPIRVVSSLDAIPEAMRQQLVSDGNQNVEVKEKKHLSVRGRPALSVLIQFSPPNPHFGPSVNLACLINDGHAIVIAQTIDFAAPGAGLPAALRRDRATQATLLAGITLV
jgi:hypothetical protein